MSDNNSTNNLTLERAKSAVLSRDYSLATRLYRTLLLSDPENQDLLFALGDLYQKSGNDAKAIPLYQQLIEKNPKDVVSMNFLGSIYRRIKQWNDSIDILEKAVIVDENNTQTFYNLGFTYKLMGRNQDAIQCFNRVVEENPNDVLAYNHIGSIYASEKEYEKSVSAYQRGLKIDPNHPILHLNLAHSYEKLGNTDFAVKEYELALRSKPGWLDAIDGYADLLLKKKDTKAVSEMLTQAIRLNPQVASVHAKMGQVWGLLGNYIGAESEYNSALKIEPKNYKTLVSLSEIYFKNGKTVDAIRTMKKGDELCGDSDMDFMARYADLMMSAEKYNAAGHKIKMMWEADSEDLQTLNLLAQYYICKGEDAKAEGCIQKIKMLDPTYYEYMVDTARRFNQVGRFAKSEQNLRKYLQMNPDSEKAMVVLAENLEKQGRLEEAIDEFQKLSAMDLDNVFYRNSLERLALALENSQIEDFDYGNTEEDCGRFQEDDLESQLRNSSDDDYEDTSMVPKIDFNNLDEQRMSPEEMVSHRNRGYSFEGLATEDRNMGSPFTPHLDEEIMASHSVDDFEDLVPEPERLPPDNSEIMRTMPINGTGMGNGPVEGLMGDKFLEEDIDGNRKVQSRTLNVSDGWDDSDDELNSYDRPEPPKRKPSRPAPVEESFEDEEISSPEDSSPMGVDGFGEEESFESMEDFESEDMENETLDSVSDDDQDDFSMEEETEDTDGSTEDEELQLSMEGDEEIFDSDDEENSDMMEFSDEEVSTESEMTVDEISDGAVEDETEDDNGYGFSFDDEEEDIFDQPKSEELMDDVQFEDPEDVQTETELVESPAVEDDVTKEIPMVQSNVETVSGSDDFEDISADDFVDKKESVVSSIEESEKTFEDIITDGDIFSEDDTFDGDGEMFNETESASDREIFMDEENLSDTPEFEEFQKDDTLSEFIDDVEGDDDDNIDVDEILDDEILEENQEDAVDSETVEDENESATETGSFFGDEKFQSDSFVETDELKLSAQLFMKLRDLSSYLPFDKKQEFLESHQNLQLEYLIKKLNGDCGLLENAQDIREKLNLTEVESSDVDANEAKNFLSHMKSYIQSLPDQNIAKSLEGEVEAAIGKL